MKHRFTLGLLSSLLSCAVHAEMSLVSDAFAEGKAIPVKHACAGKGGENVSFPLVWNGAPKESASFAVVMDDEVSPCGGGDAACRHWGVFNVPASVTSFAEGQSFDEMKGVTLGKSYSGATGYDGMCPPNPHTYKITVYALKKGAPGVEADVEMTRSQFAAKFKDYILDDATLSGQFEP